MQYLNDFHNCLCHNPIGAAAVAVIFVTTTTVNVVNFVELHFVLFMANWIFNRYLIQMFCNQINILAQN